MVDCVRLLDEVRLDRIYDGNIAVSPVFILGGTWKALRHILSQQAGQRVLFVHLSNFHCCDLTIGGTWQLPVIKKYDKFLYKNS